MEDTGKQISVYDKEKLSDNWNPPTPQSAQVIVGNQSSSVQRLSFICQRGNKGGSPPQGWAD